MNLTHESLKEFVIKYIYNDKKSKHFGKMWTAKWKKIKKWKIKIIFKAWSRPRFKHRVSVLSNSMIQMKKDIRVIHECIFKLSES